MVHNSMVSTSGAVFPPPVPLLASTESDDHVDSAADLSPVAGPSSLLDEAADLLLPRSVDGPNITVSNPGVVVPVPDVASLPPVPLLPSTVSDDRVAPCGGAFSADGYARKQWDAVDPLHSKYLEPIAAVPGSLLGLASDLLMSPAGDPVIPAQNPEAVVPGSDDAAVPGSLLGMASDLLLSPTGDPVIPAQNPEAVVPVPDVVFRSPVPLLASIAPDHHDHTDAGVDLSPAAVPGSLVGMTSDLHLSPVADPVIPVQIPGVATMCSTTLETAASLVDPPTSHAATHDSVPDTLITDVAELVTSNVRRSSPSATRSTGFRGHHPLSTAGRSQEYPSAGGM
jgi:hypothetical protein